MNSLLPLLLHWLHVYGYPMLWLIVFVAAVGLPLPTSLVLLAAGAFAGRDDFNIVLLMGITITASSCGDNVGYFIGRRWGSRTLQWLGKPRRPHLIPFCLITRSRLYFKRRGGWAIFFSRFLFSALGGVMNLLAGADRYPYRRFLLYDVTGETLGAVIPLSLGYAFGACWEAGDNLLGALLAQILAFILVSIAGIVFPYRLRHVWEAAGGHKLLGIPSVTLAGIGGVIVLGSLMVMFIFNSTINSTFGVTARLSLSFMIGVVVVGIIWYIAAYFLNRAQSIDLGLTYREIPPE